MAGNATDNPTPAHGRLLLVLLLLSGIAGLVYQVLWMKQLGLLFGNTAEAASVTLAAFFAGLAAGGWFWGRRVSRSANPLRLYAYLELAIALTAMAYFGILELFYALYPTVYQSTGSEAVLLAIKFALALLLIFPPAFCMGGTLPALGQWLIRTPSRFGRTSALLYGINTLGAAIGVTSAAFVLIPNLGFRTSYAVAITISLAVGIVAWWLSAKSDAPAPIDEPTPAPPTDSPDNAGAGFPSIAVGILCFLSGFAVLALEVLWTRMFAQVHGNSVYAFAVMLTVVLIGLAIGAWLSSQLARLKHPPTSTLGLLIAIGGAALVAGPSLFMAATNGMKPRSSLEPWAQYMANLFGMGFVGIGLVVVALGMVFPFIMKVHERHAGQPGHALGRLLALNTLGSILGALVCGFVLLPQLGMWPTMQVIAVLYLLAGLILPRGWQPTATASRCICITGLVLLFTFLNPADLSATGKLNPGAPDRVLETWEGSDATITVIEAPDSSRTILLNTGYKLGSTAAFIEQANQSRIPLMLFPQTKSIFYLGMGTGMSAGAALEPRFENVERVVVCELSPHVLTAARQYMPPEMTNGLFDDPRVTIHIEDGRHFLRVTDQTFDMINADLFLPYRRGAGSLYSLEHFQAAKQRLNPGGVYVQWLPMFQLTESEFGIIARTMIEAFGQVTMWRNNFTPGQDIVALIGQVEPASIAPSPGSIRSEMLAFAGSLNWQMVVPNQIAPRAETMPFHYGGNLTQAAELFAKYPINTDDRPRIEYQTPRTFRAQAAKADQAQQIEQKVIWFVGPKLADRVDAVFARAPLADDPMLADRSDANRRLALAGAAFHRSMYLRVFRQIDASLAQWQVFIENWVAAAE